MMLNGFDIGGDGHLRKAALRKSVLTDGGHAGGQQGEEHAGQRRAALEAVHGGEVGIIGPGDTGKRGAVAKRILADGGKGVRKPDFLQRRPVKSPLADGEQPGRQRDRRQTAGERGSRNLRHGGGRQIHISQLAKSERTNPQRGQRIGNSRLRQRGAAEKGPLAQCGEGAAGQIHSVQQHTAPERLLTDGLKVGGKLDRDQLTAALKRLLVDGGHRALGQINALQLAAVAERPFADVGQRGRRGDGRQVGMAVESALGYHRHRQVVNGQGDDELRDGLIASNDLHMVTVDGIKQIAEAVAA